MSGGENALEHLYETFMREQSFDVSPKSLYAPVNYLMNLPAKRVRPRLCLMTCKLFSVDPGVALPQAYAVELFHNFTLMHDDIMDQAPIRRGHPSTHAKYGLNAAILSGDVMLIHCYNYLCEGLSQTKAGHAVKLFTEVAINICHGQQMDMDFEDGDLPTLDQYLTMIEYKTAILLGCAMSLGALVGGAHPRTRMKLFNIGVGMGMAFQIQDDLLDVFGNSSKTGKIQGGDILQGKKTLLFLKAIEIGGSRVEAELMALYADQRMVPEQKVNRVVEIFSSLGVQQHAQRLQKKYYANASTMLDQVQGDQTALNELQSLFAELLYRES